jgi:hypothetical protein
MMQKQIISKKKKKSEEIDSLENTIENSKDIITIKPNSSIYRYTVIAKAGL